MTNPTTHRFTLESVLFFAALLILPVQAIGQPKNKTGKAASKVLQSKAKSKAKTRAKSKAKTRAKSKAKTRAKSKAKIRSKSKAKLKKKKRNRRRQAKRTRRGKRGFKWGRYRVSKGETPKKVARLLGVRLKDLKRWNRIRGRRLKPGRSLRYYGKPIVSESIGRPNNGSLKWGVNIDSDGDNLGVGFALAKRRFATWGIPELVNLIRHCGRNFRRYFPRGKGPSIAVGDLSSRNGGSLPPHVSHQSGRDADIGFIRKRPPKPGIFLNTRPREMDMYKQWVLTKCFLDSPKTQMIFIERSLVNAMKTYLKKRLYRTRPYKLRKYLPYFPGGRKAVIRADNSHRSHMHVRINCPKTDRKCIP